MELVASVCILPCTVCFVCCVCAHTHWWTLVCVQDFAVHSWDPKVQLAFDTQVGVTPRRIEIER